MSKDIEKKNCNPDWLEEVERRKRMVPRDTLESIILEYYHDLRESIERRVYICDMCDLEKTIVFKDNRSRRVYSADGCCICEESKEDGKQ